MEARQGFARVLIWGLVLVGTQVWAQALNVRVATAYSPDNFQTQNLQRFADDVAKATDGKVRFKLHPNGTLLKPTEIYAGVRDGRAEAGEVIMSSLARENALFGLDALMFIVADYDDARRMWDVSRPGIEKALDERGLKLLYAVPWPPQNLYAKQPIRLVRDFRGLRMRNYNQATERIAELIGAQPITIQVVDLGKAIAEDRLDLMFTSSWTGVDAKAWSNLRYYYKVNAWIPKNMVFISKRIFSKLDEETQNRILKAARVAEQRGWKLSQENDGNFENQLIANKILVSDIDPFIRQYLDRMGEKLAREWLNKARSDELSVLLRYISEGSIK